MSYTVIPAGQIINANQIGLGINSTNLYAPNFDLVTQAIDDLKFLLLTRIGEIPMTPTFGTRLLYVLFEQNANSSDLKEEIADLITTAVNAWLPELDVEKIDVTTSEDDPTLSHDIIIKLTVNFEAILISSVIVEIAANNSGAIIVSSQIGS